MEAGLISFRLFTFKEYDTMPCRIASKIDFDHFQEYVLTNNIINKSDFKTLSLSNIYGLTAAHEAFNDANWKPSSDDESYRTGCTIATGISGISEIADAALALTNSSKGYKSMSPYFVTKILPNLSSGLISIRHKIKVVYQVSCPHVLAQIVFSLTIDTGSVHNTNHGLRRRFACNLRCV